MYGFHQYTYVTASPQQVFDLLSDQSRTHTWLPKTVSSEVIGGGKMQAGCHLRQIRMHRTKEVVVRVEVLSHIPASKLTVRCTIMGVVATFTFSLLGENELTKVTITSEFEGKGLAMMLEQLVADGCAKENRKILLNLENLLRTEQAETALAAR